MNRRVLALSAAAAAAFLVSCDSPTRPPTTGRVAPRISFVADPTNPRAVQPVDGVRATLTTTSNGLVESITLTQPGGAGTDWRGTFADLQPGQYLLTVEGLVNNQIQNYGRSNPITVVAGSPQPATVIAALAVPTVPAQTVADTVDFTQAVTLATGFNAASWEYQISTDPTFANNPNPIQTNGATFTVTFPDVGTWHVRSRPILPFQVTQQVIWSDPRTYVVRPSTGGRTSAEAQAVAPVSGVPETITDRNITSALTDGWYTLPARAGDSLFAETFAQRLTPASPLNTTIALLRADGVTPVGTVTDDIAGSTDSRVVGVAPATETYFVRVGRTGTTVGQYSVTLEMRRLPAAPTNLTAVAASANSVTLGWGDNADNETSYRIERCLGAACGGADFAEVNAGNAPDAVSFTDANLTPGATYRYRVRARNAIGNSAYTSTATVALIGPAAPFGLTATTISGTQIDLAWTDTTSNETGFEIQRCTLVTCTDPDFTTVTTVPANTVAYQNTGIAVDGTYTYRVRAVNAVGLSAFTTPASANTIRPAAPTGLTAATQSAGRIDLTWADIATNETGYRIERCAGAGCSGFAEIATTGADATTYSDLTTVVDVYYSYRVRAYNVPGNSNYSNTASADTRRPGTPASFAATVISATRVDLSWADTSSAETGFEIDRCTGAACTDFTLRTAAAPGVTSFSDLTVAVGNTYRYRIRATGIAGNSPDAGPVAAAVLLPATPTAPSATTVSGTRIDLAWTDAATNEQSVRIERCAGPACVDFAEVGSTAANAVAFSDVGVVVGNVYRYRLRTRNQVGDSPYSGIVSASTEVPTAPTLLTATTIDAGQIDLAWAHTGTTETGFLVERCLGDACTNFVAITTVAPDVLTYQDTGVAGGESYRYRVFAVNLAGPSAPTNIASATTAVPVTPTGLTVTTLTATRLSLAWTDASPFETGFEVQRCDGAGCVDFAAIDSTAANVATFVDSTVSSGTTYQYRVRAFNIIGNSVPSASVLGDTRAPDAPTGLSAVTVSGARIDLSWTDAAVNELGVIVERCTGAGCSDFAAYDTVAAPATGYQDTGVAVDETYHYRVRAYNNAGQSDASSEAIAATLLPAAPSDLVATTQSPTAIGLTWVNNAVDANGFIIERCSGPGCATFAALDSTGAGVTVFTDNTVSAGNSYTYQVRARNISGRSAPSGPATTSTIVPNAPTGLVAATQSNTAIGLSWTDAASDETGFYIERCEGASCTTFTLVDSVGADIVAYSSTGLTPSQSYTFRVRAYNASGASAYSNEASATTNLPAIPTALSALAISTGRIDLSWTDNATDELGYRIERCLGLACTDFAEIDVTAADVTAYEDNSVSSGETYRYRLRAYNAAGASDYSNIGASSTTLPIAPFNVTANATSTTSVTVRWQDASDNETGFAIDRCTGAGCSTYISVATLPPGTEEFVDNTVTPGNIYGYVVTALGNIGNASTAAASEASTILPSAPTDLAATTVSASQIDLAWTDVATNETAYEVERCAGAACVDFVRVDSLPANTATYNDVGLAANVVFRYRVRALNGAGPSGYSAIASAATDVPADPTDLAALATSGTSVRIDWTDNANNETDFVIQRCAGSSANCGDAQFLDLQLVGANVTTYVDGTLAAGDTVTYRVKAINLNGESRYSNAASASTTVPVTPTNLDAQTISGSRVDLTWSDEARNETGYEVERCAGVACVTFARIDSLGPDVTTYSDLTVTTNETYTYRVRAVNLVGVSGYTGDATVNTILPLAPSTLSATTISATQVDLAWVDNATNEVGFNIERCTGVGCSDFTLLATAPADAAAYSDFSVLLGETYRYRVQAYNIAGPSAFDGPVTSTTLLPADPSDLVATVTAPTEITLNWTDNAGNEQGFRLERCSGAGCSSFVQIATPGADATQYVDAGLNTNTFYRYRLRAYNAAGVSGYTGIASPNTFAPAAPSTLSGTTVLGNRIDLTWTDISNNETGFRIERCTGAACVNFAEVATAAANVTTHADSTLAFGTQYRFRVRSYNGVSNSAYSNIVDANTNVPLDPSALTAVANGTTRIDLTWSDNSANETGFRIERCTGPGCSDFATLTTTAANATAYSDTPVAAATSYTYRVTAFNEGRSGFTAPATATTILPAEPTGLLATAVAGDRVDLAWADNADNEFGYQIERCAGAACVNFALVTTTAADAASYQDLGLGGATLYRYRIRAVNGAGTSAYTSVAEATTNVPGIPTTLTATTISASQIDLAWVDNATDELGFVIERCVGASCTDFAPVDSVESPNAILYNDVGLAAATSFRYRVRAYNASGVSGASNIAAAGTNVPADPSALVATTVSATRIDLAWADNADNEGGYTVQRCLGAACVDFTDLVTLGIGATSYSDLSPLVDQAFRYRVRASNNAGVSGFSNIADADTERPAAPTALFATTVSATRIDLTWTDNADNEATLRVERCTGAGCVDFTEIQSLPANSITFADEGLSPNESYSYRVRAVNIPGASDYAGPATATTSIPADPTALFTATISPTRIDLTWTDNSTNELRFIIERCAAVDCAGGGVVIDSVGADVATYADQGVTLGNTYGYRVYARNSAGTSGASNIAVGSTLLPNDPSAPIAVIAAPDRVDLSWTDGSDNETRFVIERCAGAGCITFAPFDSVSADVTTFADLSVVASEYYSYRVRAVNAAGSSGATNAAETALIIPEAPTDLVATTLSATQARIDWTDRSFNETGFQIERCASAGCPTFTIIDTVAANVATYQSDDLVFEESYSYRVTALNPVGTSAPTNEATTTTFLPDPATGLVATVAGPSRIDLAWVDASTNEAGFRIERCLGTGCGDFVEINVTGPGVASYIDNAVSLNTAYSYRVRPFNAVGPAAYSGTASENTFLPADPAGFTATAITANRIDLAWTDVATNETGYAIEACFAVGCTNFGQVLTLPANTTSHTFPSVAANIHFRFRIRAVRSPVGFSNYSGVSDAPTILNAPTITRAQTVLRNRIDISWNDNSTIETGYQVIYCAGAGCVPNLLAGTVGANVTSFSHVGLAQASTYSYAVRAVSNSVLSGTSPVAGAYTPVTMTSGQTITGISDTLRAERYYVISVPAGTPELRINMGTGVGEADLHVRYGAAPTISTFDCRPYPYGTPESCVIQNPAAGDWYLMPHAWEAISGISVSTSLGIRYGYPTAFAGSSSWSAGYLIGQQITVSRAINVTHLGFWTSGGTGGFRVGLYTNTGSGTPGTLVSQASGTITTTGFQEFAATAAVIPAGTYWMMFNFQNAITRNQQTLTPATVNYVPFTWGSGLPINYTTQPYNILTAPFGYRAYTGELANGWVRGYP